jgi:prepilin-type processing-associated H-X9-DG protein
MSKVIQVSLSILVLLAGIAMVHRIMLARAEEKFQLERSRCQLVLAKLGGELATSSNKSSKEHIFVDASTLGKIRQSFSGELPAAYDRHLNNHGGRGINILMVDGTVRWDPNATWLKQFAAKHAESQLPIPQ